MNEMPPLWEHQRLGKSRALEAGDFAFFMEMGTGKSRTMLEVLRELYTREHRVLRTLIPAPVLVVPNWRAEIAKYTRIPEGNVTELNGPGPRRLKAFAQARKVNPEGFIAITNYEALVAIKGLFEELLAWRPEVLVFDESQRIKTHNSKRTAKAHALARGARFRYLLSGSPILNSPMDAWAQYRAMDLGKSFGDNYWSFRARYFVDKNAAMPRDVHFPNWVLRPGAAEEFQRKISETALVVKKADCLDLPPLVRQVISVDLSPEQARHYKEMKNEFITFLGDAACTAQLAITKALRLQQIVTGHMPLDDEEKTVTEFRNTPREEALKETLSDILEDPTHKVLIWACWRADYEVIRRVCKELGCGLVEIHGEISDTQKRANVERFRVDPSASVLLGHPGSGGVGINLVEASYMIYYSRSFNLEHDLQSEARNYRAGSERHAKVTRIDLVARNTIDEEIQKALANKVQIGEALLKSIKDNL